MEQMWHWELCFSKKY